MDFLALSICCTVDAQAFESNGLVEIRRPVDIGETSAMYRLLLNKLDSPDLQERRDKMMGFGNLHTQVMNTATHCLILPSAPRPLPEDLS
jgi:hypothetical protein